MKTFFVQTKTIFDKDVKTKLFQLSDDAVKIFKEQQGFVSIQRFISVDKNFMTSIIEWETKEDHEACMASSDFNDFNAEWEEMLNNGKIQFKLECYISID